MFKDIVLPITGTSGDSHALSMALDLASAHGGHLTALVLVNLPEPISGPWGLAPDPSMDDIHRKLREQGQARVAGLKQRLEKETASNEVRLVEGFFSDAALLAAHYAHYADLSIVPGAADDSMEGGTCRAYFGSLLIHSGRPVLVVPPGCKVPMPPKRIAAAWRPTRECARAFHDSLPLMRAADSVEVLVVDPPGGDRGTSEQPGTSIAAHLSRHGVNVNVQVRKSNDNRVAAVLLEHVGQTQANMLVVGGYGRSRLREWAMGGVTRELLFDARVPVFYSH